MNEAGVYRCPSCGAPADPKSASCAYCSAALSPVRCPWCFAWIDAKARGCPTCGAVAEAASEGAAPLTCPTCADRPPLSTRTLGGARLSGCAVCQGVWTDAASFRRLCEDRSTQAAYMGPGSVLARPAISDPSQTGIFYRPCPVCRELMNRFNFAGCSGVILDACKPHGVWFDADELRRIVAFIRDGGLDVAREHEMRDLEAERGRLESAGNGLQRPVTGFTVQNVENIATARGLLAHLLGAED
ncbi:MAG: zf-TFIIB domain-containing protein [Elusimicrobiota bacterium]